MEFPHLSDTQFPMLQNVDVYSFKNEFDYTRWVPDTNITLCNVLWDSTYKDVVKFDDNDKRDSYFDNLTDVYNVTLESDARVVPEGYIKLPIPYDVMARYNYMFIDLPIATSDTQMIDYETANGIRRWYFFVDNIRYMAPNTTEVFITLDVWNNFINDIKFKYTMLERGHAPVAVTDTDTYLKNPIDNCEYLLAGDINFGSAEIVKHNKMVPVGNGKKYVCFIITTDFTDFSFGYAIQSPDYTYSRPLTYNDYPYRQGYQVKVNNYGIGNGYNYEQVQTPVHGGCNSTDDVLPNNVFCVAVKASDCIGNNNFITYILETQPSFMNSVQCAFMASDDMIEIERKTTLGSYAIYSVKKKRSSKGNLTLTKDMFDYPEEMQRFAKLYTFPYASIEISDDDGNTTEIKIENVSNRAEIMTDFSLAYPYLNARVFLTGIAKDGLDQTHYEWRKMNDEKLIMNTPASEWSKYMVEYNIPTYALFMDGKTAWNMTNFNRGAKAARLNALTAYHTNARDANTAYENALNDHATSHKNAVNMAKTNRINADNTALGNKTIADNSNDVYVINTENNINNTETNCAVTNVINAANGDQTLYNNMLGTVYSVNAAYKKLKLNNYVMDQTKDAQAQTQAQLNNNNTQLANQGTMITTTLGVAGAGAMVAAVGTGAIAGSAVPVIGTLVGAGVGLVSAITMTANNWNTTQQNNALLIGCNDFIVGKTVTLNEDIARVDRSYSAFVQNDSNKLAATVLDNNIINNHLCTQNNVETTRATVGNANSASRSAAATTYNIATTNNNNLRNVSTTNADNTKNNADANSLYTRENAIMNLKEILETSQDVAQASMNDAKNQRPVSYGVYGGDISGDAYMNRGMRIRVKTQNKSAIKQTADYFARYGYALNQMWDIESSGLCMMKYFTFWKCSDVWVDDTLASNNLTQKTIEAIMENGVTVWSDPDVIGKVGVYDNE